jgi:predicted transcriptional regulator
MEDRKIFKIILILSILLFLIVPQVVYAEEVPRMTKEELKAMIDNPDLVIIDVRSGRDWKSSESKIKNAVREEPREAESWADKYDRSKTYVLYCA